MNQSLLFIHANMEVQERPLWSMESFKCMSESNRAELCSSMILSFLRNITLVIIGAAPVYTPTSSDESVSFSFALTSIHSYLFLITATLTDAH